MGWVKIVVPQWLDPMVFLDQQSWWDVFGYELEKHVVCFCLNIHIYRLLVGGLEHFFFFHNIWDNPSH